MKNSTFIELIVIISRFCLKNVDETRFFMGKIRFIREKVHLFITDREFFIKLNFAGQKMVQYLHS